MRATLSYKWSFKTEIWCKGTSNCHKKDPTREKSWFPSYLTTIRIHLPNKCWGGEIASDILMQILLPSYSINTKDKERILCKLKKVIVSQSNVNQFQILVSIAVWGYVYYQKSLPVVFYTLIFWNWQKYLIKY